MKKIILYVIIGIFLLCNFMHSSCKKDDPSNQDVPPTLKTLPLSEVSLTTAQSGGYITDDGGSDIYSRGVVWCSMPDPTIDNHMGITIQGVGKGYYISTLTGLTPETQYYVRAYALNHYGAGYGDLLAFSTAAVEVYPPGYVHCDPSNPTAIVDVTNPVTGNTWMDRNLGASQVATSSADYAAHGDLYQWGRFADGHHCRYSENTNIISSSDQPGHGDFIVISFPDSDWRSPLNQNLWQGINGINNPCPLGYRVPTEAEWDAERQSWNTTNATGALDSPIRLPLGGLRPSSGSLGPVGTHGFYWSSTVLSTVSRQLTITSSNAYIAHDSRAYGLSVRCIK